MILDSYLLALLSRPETNEVAEGWARGWVHSQSISYILSGVKLYKTVFSEYTTQYICFTICNLTIEFYALSSGRLDLDP
jgi:hypothetical protein